MTAPTRLASGSVPGRPSGSATLERVLCSFDDFRLAHPDYAFADPQIACPGRPAGKWSWTSVATKWEVA